MRNATAFTLGDFIAQMANVKCPRRKARSLARKLGLPQLDNVDIEAQCRRMCGMFDAMTPAEREAPERLDAARRGASPAGPAWP